MQTDNTQDTPDIPTHPADPTANGDQDKVVGKPGAVRDKDYNDPPPDGAGKGTGQPLDNVGGSMGKPPWQTD